MFLLNPQNRPSPIDTLFLTVRLLQDPDKVVAGARIPLNQVKFPFRFIMKDQNVIGGKERAKEIAAAQQDLLIRAYICPGIAAEDDSEEAPAATIGSGNSASNSGRSKGKANNNGNNSNGNSSNQMCSREDAILEGVGLAKLIKNVGGMSIDPDSVQNDGSIVIRAGASVGLE